VLVFYLQVRIWDKKGVTEPHQAGAAGLAGAAGSVGAAGPPSAASPAPCYDPSPDDYHFHKHTLYG
jgi:hypothetical protein